jgi:ribosomal protein S18 acetylase RimI-like enzyme
MTIAPAVQGDFEWCARLMASSDPWLTLGRGLEACRAALARPERTLWTAREGSAACGFLLLDPRGVAGSPYVASVAVAPEWRGRGVGSALLGHAETSVPEARYIFLCVSSFNGNARRLYERRGYMLVGELPDYVIEGASEYLMCKRLVR